MWRGTWAMREHGAQAGAQEPARRRRPDAAGGHEVPVAGEPGLDAARAPVAAVAVQGRVPAHRPRMGAKGDGLEAVGRHGHGLGAHGVAGVGRTRVAEQARADGARSADGGEAPRGDPHRSGAEGDQHGSGVDERQDPAGVPLASPHSPQPAKPSWTSSGFKSLSAH